MTFWSAVFTGIVYGLTELFPVSGSGHLSILSHLFKISISDHYLFYALMQFAVIVAICVSFWEDIVVMFYELMAVGGRGPLAGTGKKHYPHARLFIMVIISTVMIALVIPVAGIMEKLSDNSFFVGVAIFLSGLCSFIFDKFDAGNKYEKNMSFADALIIGLCQCVSCLPGMSRTALTMTAGAATGLNKNFALRYSFLLAVPALFASFVRNLVKGISQGILWADFAPYLAGTVAALLAAYGAGRLLRIVAEKHDFRAFSYYCWVMGVLSIILAFIF